MARVMIKCPTTGEPVSTGMDMDSLEGVSLSNNTLRDCPECGQDHVWQGSDAFLEE